MMTKGLEAAINQLGQVEAYILGKMRKEYGVDTATVIELAECLSQVHLTLVETSLASYKGGERGSQ